MVIYPMKSSHYKLSVPKQRLYNIFNKQGGFYE
jgi:hypothetical protein